MSTQKLWIISSEPDSRFIFFVCYERRYRYDPMQHILGNPNGINQETLIKSYPSLL